MADPIPPLRSHAEYRFDSDRIDALLKTLENMASGQVDERLPISPDRDVLDAIAYGINVLVGELSWASARAREAQEMRAAELQDALSSAEVRNSALVRAIPDLMFVLQRDGTYVDYHARDPELLFVPPREFLGRNVRDVLPPDLAQTMVAALERAWEGDDPVVVEYQLEMGEPRFYEARIVRAGQDRLLTIVRDVTEARRAWELNRDLARRLIVRQEIERQRIARELHDDVSQRLALLNVEIDQIAARADAAASKGSLRKLAADVEDISAAVHNLTYDLHPSRLQVIGLVSAMRSLCDHTSQSRSLSVTFTSSTVPSSVDAKVSLCLYRIAQEGLHNIVRHSGARDAQVALTCDESEIELRIADSGNGFDPQRMPYAGLGLVSMEERVAALKGQLHIDSAPGKGTQISVRIPLVSQ